MSAVTIGILAIQGNVEEHNHALQELNVKTCYIRTAAQLDTIDGLILPGGESSAISRIMQRSDLGEVLKEKIASGLPCYGTCAGMILLAKTLDPEDNRVHNLSAIDMTVQRNAFGRQYDSREFSLNCKEIGDNVSAVFIRAPKVCSVGPAVSILSRIRVRKSSYEFYEGPEQYDDSIVAVRQGHCLATAFHPELTADRRVHQYFLTMVG